MKIVAIGLRGIPNVMGGIETHCQELYARWLEIDSSLDITVIARSPYISKDQVYKGVKVKPIWTLKSKLFETILHTFFSVLYAKFFLKADVIHLHAIGPGLFTPIIRLLGIKVVVTHHGADYNRKKWDKFAKLILRVGESLAVKFSNELIVVGETLTSELKLQHPIHANKITYIPNGVSISTEVSKGYNSSALLSDLLIKPKEYILFVGRLVPEKGVSDLIKAFNQSHTELKLVILGSTDHKDNYYQSLKNNASESIIFAGFRNGDDLKALFHNAKLFVLPSYHEGLPIALLEAIGHSLPVIVSDITPNQDVGLPKQCYFEVGNIDSLATKLASKSFEQFQVNWDEYRVKFDWVNISKKSLILVKRICKC